MDKSNVFAINLVKRTDRRESIISEFSDKEEFQLTIVPAIEHQVGAIGLWQTLCGIVRKGYEEDLEYVIICEDDHTFTSHYSPLIFQKSMADAMNFQMDVLLGGVSWFSTCFPVTQRLNWVEKFSGLQFTVIFKKFYTKILNTNFQDSDAADYKLSFLSDQIYFIYPFISVQKDFGYSDVTLKNNAKKRIVNLFKDSCELVNAAKQVLSFYKKKIETQVKHQVLADFDKMSVSTYILNSKDCKRNLSRILSQFEGRSEFDVRIIKLYEHEPTNPENAYWLTLNKIVQQACDEGDDVIIVCDDNHLFTKEYSRISLIKHIIEGHQLDTKILCGGVDDFETPIPVIRDKFWVKSFKSSPFIVLYKSVFEKILKLTINKNLTPENFFREITSNKLVIFPFISIREDSNKANLKIIIPSHETISSRLKKIYQIAESSKISF
ncbi:hypothetical protein [Aquiflexum sp.]|uniref:hypothetical protein n=1 Tax=Aquiflexum sp. TaxID=1872584 RepID=UPI0035932747